MKKLFTLIMLCSAGFLFGQSTTGKIIDAADNTPLVGATVVIDGTDVGTITDIDGTFSLNASKGDNLVISYLGYDTKMIEITSMGDLGDIGISAGSILSEIVVTSTMDIVRDRRTPVAVSTIPASVIQSKVVGNVELGEVAKATPSIFIANQAGGYGDSEVWTRGFDQSNTAFLLNGQPINGMEDGKMYWSNWSGLTDVASAVQIQRGLGASKLAISSVGGTWNFVMKATENEKGGSVFSTIGNDGYRKMGAAYSTGLSDNKFAVTLLASAWSGNGYAYGTRGQGQTYYLSAGYKPNENHTINFLVTGAPQWHDQKFQTSIYSHENADGEIDRRYNGNWGVYDGQYFSERRNYYHKPVMNLNWDWNIDSKSDIGVVLYGSFGRGGGTGGIGGGTTKTESGLIDFDATAIDSTSGYVRRSSVNNHNWFGSVVKYERQLSSNLNFSVGGDLRRYYGDHFRQVSEFFGRDGYTQGFHARYDNGYTVTKAFDANPWSALSNFAGRESEERIAYNNGETINYVGGFTQVEYSNNAFSAYIQGALSTQNHVRHEYFYESLENEDSEKVTNNGYNLKLGLSYALNESNIVFANAGQYSRQPFHDVIFEGNSNKLSANLSNETITGFEVGYKYFGETVFANVNGYYTLWQDRILQNFFDADPGDTVQLADGSDYVMVDEAYENILQDQLHIGVELDLGVNITEDLSLKAFGSVGQWNVIGDRQVSLLDGLPRAVVNDFTTKSDDIEVGGAPQTSFGAALNYNILENFNTELQYIYYDRMFANNGGIQLPSYGIFDLNLGYSIPMDDNVLRLGVNVYNLFDAFYISKSRTSNEADTDVPENNWNGINKSNQVTFGKGRTWNFTMKYSF